MEQEPGEETVETLEAKTFTQEQMDGIIQGRLGKVQAKFESELEAIRSTNSDLELRLQEKSATVMTDTEHMVALKKSLEATQSELEEFKAQSEAEKKAKVVKAFDDADKQALLEAGANPKYANMLLDQIKKSRGIEDGTAFYKDGEGAAIDKSAIIEAVKAGNSELFLVNRVKGNSVPHGEAVTGAAVDYSKESTADFIARRNAERAEGN